MSIYNTRRCTRFTAYSLFLISLTCVGVSTSSLADTNIVQTNSEIDITYISAMSGYRTLNEDNKNDWKQANEKVGEIGGWRTYAREAFLANKRLEEEQLSLDGSVEESIEKSGELDESFASTTSEDISGSTTDENVVSMRNPTSGKIDFGLKHNSAIELYRNYEEVTLQDWKAANDRVGEIGGWRAYAREAFLANKRLAEEAEANQ